MNIQKMHLGFQMPRKSTTGSGALDIAMPEAGTISANAQAGHKVSLGFAAEVPSGHVALIVPRSGVGAKNGVSLNNTVGVIDSDYRGEWFAYLRLRNTQHDFSWQAGERLLQALIVPITNVELCEVTELSKTERNTGGFGSTGR